MAIAKKDKVLITKLSVRDLILLSLYRNGKAIYKPLIRIWSKNKKNGLKQVRVEIKRMKKDLLLTDGFDKKRRLVSLLRFPDGFKAMDKFVKSFKLFEEDIWTPKDEAQRLIAKARKAGISKITIKKIYTSHKVDFRTLS